jgi:hypothetical protein
MELPEFEKYPSIPRLNRDVIITEKIDGANASIRITPEGDFHCASRNRWLNPLQDNAGFCKWALAHEEQLRWLGPGRHFGEWYGQGIQIGYGLKERRFALFHSERVCGDNPVPPCCEVVPTLYTGPNSEGRINCTLLMLGVEGSQAVPGWMKPEGIVIFHTASRQLYKVTLENDEKGKSYGS